MTASGSSVGVFEFVEFIYIEIPDMDSKGFPEIARVSWRWARKAKHRRDNHRESQGKPGIAT